MENKKEGIDDYFFFSDGRPFGYWIGRNNESHYYWGGTFREVQMCGCAINQTCIDPKFQCNCDADYRQWWENDTLS